MKLSEYKEAMEEIKFDSTNLGESFQNKRKSQMIIKRKKAAAALAMAAVLIVCMLFTQDFKDVEPAISVTVYAAEKEGVQLTKDFVDIKMNANMNYGEYSVDSDGKAVNPEVNYNIYVKCEGQDIESITYSTTDKEITRNNLGSTSAYYVENLTMPVGEYKKTNWQKDETFLSGFYGVYENEASVTKLIGNSYTVTYENQMNKQYGLVVNSTVDEESKFHFEDFSIKVNITLKDGSSFQKELIVHAGDNAETEIEMKLL